ncbi:MULTISPECIES: hypothetical protein [Ruminococcus]|uniref:Uncharacterized protein n=1 Tax=Ruminococcus flavefaciens TaxID=1265 RepID=A0A1M7LIJ5_RUMFL|nr:MULTISPECIES: hypothetical protein [Ruminococcus]MCR4794954.1 hypothetical protein [Ruminococcus sp.]SHM77808.1 hypothetical protein SAMN04487860_11389 [Ruminococcus flavefaciens]
MNNKYNAAALAFALLATSSAAMSADNTSSQPMLTAQAAANENVKAVAANQAAKPINIGFNRKYRVNKPFIAIKNGFIKKEDAEKNVVAALNLNNAVKMYKVGEIVYLNKLGYDMYGFDLKPYINKLTLIAR